MWSYIVFRYKGKSGCFIEFSEDNVFVLLVYGDIYGFCFFCNYNWSNEKWYWWGGFLRDRVLV